MSQSVPVLMYHHVSPNPGLVTVSPETFARQMSALSESGFNALGADQFLDFIMGRESVPEKSVLLTFDDGYLDNYVFAFPVLERYRLRATIFAVTGWITDGPERSHAGLNSSAGLPQTPDHRTCKAAIAAGKADEVMLRWSEIERMESSGVIETHSHTHNHVRWDKGIADVDARHSEVKRDLASSRETLRLRLGKHSKHLCWPWGYFEPGYQAAASDLGFEAQYTVAKGINTPSGNARNIARIVIKDRPGIWFTSRLWIYRHSVIGSIYSRLRGE